MDTKTERIGKAEVSRGRVLVVDDENGPRQALRILLNETHDVGLASSVTEALAILEHDPFEVIVTDVRMPKLSGVDLLSAVKKAQPDVQVIILTGYGQLETAMKAVEYGAFAYIEKPFDNETMLRQVAAARERFRMERDRRALERLALEANRFETLGRVVSGLIHDLGTPLSVIGSQVELLLREPTQEGVEKRLQAMRSQVSLCTEIVRSTMSFLRPQPEQFTRLNINDVVASCLEVGYPLLRGQSVKVSQMLSNDLPRFKGDFVLVRQAVLNLITNACHAMAHQPEKQELHFRTWAEANQVFLSVQDTGPGVPSSHRESIFATFFSTKPGQGTGLGLSVVKNVMRRHGGDVRLGDGEGRGAEFILSFPASQDETAAQ